MYFFYYSLLCLKSVSDNANIGRHAGTIYTDRQTGIKPDIGRQADILRGNRKQALHSQAHGHSHRQTGIKPDLGRQADMQTGNRKQV
jgi:hypothetical protein